MSILEAENIIKQYTQYDTTVNAVDHVSFKIEDGEFVAIIGASGSGKSTLLHICAGLDRPNSGNVIILGRSITRMNRDELAAFRGQYTGFIFQNHNLIPQFTALENIMIPTIMCNKEQERFEEHLKLLIKTLDIGDRLNHLPSELSGGQQQRVAIARALINRPQVLFADEPTGNLDRTNADEVLRLLMKTKEAMNQTLIMVTHDLTIADHADRIFKMENGKLYPFRESRRHSHEAADESVKQ